MLHVLITMRANAAPYLEGERYNLPEDVAAKLVADGLAEPTAVHAEQLCGPVTDEERAACLERVKAAAPPASV